MIRVFSAPALPETFRTWLRRAHAYSNGAASTRLDLARHAWHNGDRAEQFARFIYGRVAYDAQVAANAKR